MRDKNGKPDYKRTAYLDARSYSETLDESNELDRKLKMYLQAELEWEEVTKIIATEENKVKKVRQRKGPWMKNCRENRNTEKLGSTSSRKRHTSRIEKQQSTKLSVVALA